MSGQPGAPEPYVQQRLALKTDRSMIIVILLSIVTFGIYNVIFYYKVSEDLNSIASKWDGKNTMNYILALVIGLVTFSIYLLVWNHMLFDRIRGELTRRQIDYNIGPGTFWGWGFFGVLLFGIGPFICLYKLCTAMNLLSEHYNVNG